MMKKHPIRYTAFSGPLKRLPSGVAGVHFVDQVNVRPVVDYSQDPGYPSEEMLARVSRMIPQDQFEPFDAP